MDVDVTVGGDSGVVDECVPGVVGVVQWRLAGQKGVYLRGLGAALA